MYVELEAGQKFALKGADRSDSHESFTDAGYVLKKSDIVIDIDNLPKDTIKKMLVQFGINTQTVWTDRGAHLYFKKPTSFSRGANRICALGFPIELKHTGNTTDVVIKRDGKLREIENEGIREQLPAIFGLNKRFKNMLGMGEGDGRNNSLYSHRMQLAGLKNNVEILRFINSNIFMDPLDESEMTVITREISLKNEDVTECDIAEHMVVKYGFVKYLGRLFFRDGKGYVSNTDRLQRLILSEVGNQKSRFVEEVIKQLEMQCKLIDDDTEFDIRFNNGILRDGKFIEIESDEFTPYMVDIDYKENAKPVEIVDNYLNQLTDNDENYKLLLGEILGHLLITNKEFKRMLAKFFIFRGDGGNGKGTLLEIIGKIINDKNVSRASLKELTDERYLVTLKGKLANLADDVNSYPITDKIMKVLKNITTCDGILVRELYKEPMNVKLSTTIICTSNHMIKSFEKGESYRRRVMWLPMFGKPKVKDPLFISKQTTKESLEYWVRLMVEGYMRLYKQGRFTVADEVEKYNKEYHEENNPALIFLGDYTAEDIEGVNGQRIYDEFKEWKKENGYPEDGGRAMLYDGIKDLFGLVIRVRKINGTSSRIFVNENEE